MLEFFNVAAALNLSPIHTNAFSFENAYFLIHFHLLYTLKNLKTPMKTCFFENSSFLCGQVNENSGEKSITCHWFQSKSEHLSKMADGLLMLTHAQSQVPVIFIIFKRFSVDR